MIDRTQFKFIVDGELMASSLHPTHYDHALKTENNIVKVSNYIFDNESKAINKKKPGLVSLLSLNNPSICQSILGKFSYY